MRKNSLSLVALVLALTFLSGTPDRGQAQSASKSASGSATAPARSPKRITPAMRKAAAARFKKLRATVPTNRRTLAAPPMDPGGVPHYYGPFANYANSPLPTGPVASVTVTNGGEDYTAPVVTINDAYNTGSGAAATAVVSGGVITAINVTSHGSGYSAPVITIDDATGAYAEATAVLGPALTGGIRKFIDKLPGLNAAAANLLGQYIPVAIPDQSSIPGSDYYELELGQATVQFHSDLPPTTYRGYRQTNTTDSSVKQFHYLGPLIKARRDRPVRVRFTNKLGTGTAGNLFLPVDTTVMGAGMGPTSGMYSENRATLHLHGGNTPWISDGTPHQWTVPAGELSTPYLKGVSTVDVPDMSASGAGALTFFWGNPQSARLQFYHDHSYGITRLNVYAGEVAPLLITDDVEADMINGTNATGINPSFLKVLPDIGIPLAIQDKTFVDATTISSQDPTWNWGTTSPTPHTGDLWFPHVYMPNQDPYDVSGANAFGRWDYGPWFWPPTQGLTYPPIANPYAGQNPWEGALIPATPNPSMVMEAYCDTPIVNGTAYPYLEVEPRVYRFRILNGCNDRFLNLQFYKADPAVFTADGRSNTEVKMVPSVATAGWPAKWPTDARVGGVPDPATMGPSWVQIGTEGGFLPAPAVIPPQPVSYNLNPKTFNYGNVENHSLLLGSAERADVLVDFSAFAGQTLIMYNDAPAAFPAADPRNDYFTGGPDNTGSGGSWITQPGFGPNTRTIMQIRVLSGPTSSLDMAGLKSVFAKTGSKRGVFEVSTDPIIIPNAAHDSAYNGSFPADTYVRIADESKTFTTLDGTSLTIPFEMKAIHDEMGAAYDTVYGRGGGLLGLEMPAASANTQQVILYPYVSPPLDLLADNITPAVPALNDGTQIWKITHNGIDTHTIHWHLVNVQLINRVAWDNTVLPPDANEIGWKETVRVNPLEATIVALRPVAPPNVPFTMPNSYRLLDPTAPEGTMLMGPPLGFMDPQGTTVISIANHYVNFGAEYVWHCHVLGHEEMDMMHSLIQILTPEAPSSLMANKYTAPLEAVLSWVDNSKCETGFTIDRATDSKFTLDTVSFSVGPNVTTYTDKTIDNSLTYFYRIRAESVIGDIDTAGFPTMSTPSAYSDPAQLGDAVLPNPPTNLGAVAVSGLQVNLTWTVPVQALAQANKRTNSKRVPTVNPVLGYRVERSTDNGLTWPTNFIVSDPLATGTSDMTVSPQTVYAYRVFAFNSIGDSLPSNVATVTTLKLPPNAPSSLTAAFNTAGTKVVLNWKDNSNNESAFFIQRRTDTTSYATIGKVGQNVKTYTDGSILANTTLYYQVLAYRTAGGYSLPSNEASIVVASLNPAAPTNLRATGIRRQAVDLAWTDNATNENGFYVERSTDGVNFTRVLTLAGANTVKATASGLAPSTTYYFRVQAYNGFGVSAYSNVLTITTKA